ncbi:hypothetical protein NESM_000236600 [Novymonas esmeraldas]|uniref:Uncharacterized protein n=1 Tax=Novymonas esmeraldas TaxID=1808958 RepID=A0AAW0F5Z8_9TRYP
MRTQRAGGGLPVLCSLANKASASTTCLRVLLAFGILLSTVSAMLYVAVLGIDVMYTVQNDNNVYYFNESGSGSSEASSSTAPGTVKHRSMLFPQLRAIVGLHTVCIGSNCVRRSRLHGVLPLVDNAAAESLGLPASGAVGTAYQDALSQYVFGFDIGVHCGTPRETTQALSSFAVAAAALSLVLLLALFVVNMLLCALVSGADVLIGSPSLDSDTHLVTVDVLNLPVAYVTYKINRHLRLEKPLLIGGGLFSLLACLTSVCAMAVTVSLNRSKSKCGQSVCAAFEHSMGLFYKTATSFKVNITTPRTFSCHNGSSYILVVVAFCLCALCLLANGLMLYCHCHSHRHEEMAAMRDQLRRLMEVQTIAGGGGGCGGGGGGGGGGEGGSLGSQVSGAGDASSSLALFMAGVTRRGSSMQRSDSSFTPGGLSRLRSTQSSPKELSRRARTVGGRIEFYRLLKQFVALEEHSRRGIRVAEGVEFQACLALRETVWFDEELCMLHKFTLDWFAGPALDLCVLETDGRQRLAVEYSSGVGEILADVDAGVRASVDGAPQQRLTAADQAEQDAAVWEQRVLRWRQVHQQISVDCQRAASYAAVEPRRLRRSPASVPLAASTPCTGLDTDAWIRRLEELRSAYVDAPFLADPFLEQSPDDVGRRQETDTTNTFSRSFPVGGGVSPLLGGDSAFTATDGVRQHLCADSGATSAAVNSPRVPQRRENPPRRLSEIPPQHNGDGGAVLPRRSSSDARVPGAPNGESGWRPQRGSPAVAESSIFADAAPAPLPACGTAHIESEPLRPTSGMATGNGKSNYADVTDSSGGRGFGSVRSRLSDAQEDGQGAPARAAQKPSADKRKNARNRAGRATLSLDEAGVSSSTAASGTATFPETDSWHKRKKVHQLL